MFTGLVEARGEIVGVAPVGDAITLMIRPDPTLADRPSDCIGDSVAINGCCLTITSIDNSVWSFQAGAETMARTNLGELKPGGLVNLERALRPGDRLGGHFVQGHVDDIGHVSRVEQNGEWTDIWFQAPARLLNQMVSKGSIAVDGVSLTLVNVEADRFSVALIPHTLQHTTLGTRKAGDRVNLETDILGKHLEKLFANSMAAFRNREGLRCP